MLILASASDKLRVQSSAAATLQIHASWVDLNGSTVTPDRANTIMTTATTADVVASPGAGVVRNVKSLTIRNTSVTPSLVTIIHTDGATAVQLHQVTLGPGASTIYSEGAGFLSVSRLEPGGDPWAGKVIACCRDGNPNYVINQMQVGGNVAPTPTNVGTSIARCEFFRPAYDIAANTLRWYGVGVTTGLYTVAIYRWSDLARITDQFTLTTAATSWNSVALPATLNLTAGELYFVAAGATTSGTTAGIGACGGTTAAATGQIAVGPNAMPGNMTPLNMSSLRFQFAVTAGAMPATAATPVAQAAWTGGMPAFFLDAA